MRFDTSNAHWRRAATLAVAAVIVSVALVGPGGRLPVGAASQSLVSVGSVWKYTDTGTTPSAWSAPTFDDSTWKQGPAPLGYGATGVATTINRLNPAHYKGDLFRRAFTTSNVGSITGLTITLQADDGAYVYINNTLVLNDNIQANGYANYRSGAANTAYRTFSVPSTALVEGWNVLAVDLRENWPSAPDSSFDLGLTATTSGATTTSTTTTSTTTTSTSTVPSTTTTTTSTVPSTTTTTTAPPGQTVLAAGDIAKCPANNHAKVATLLHSLPGPFLALGDNAYPHGALSDFQSCYDPYFGSEKARTRPIPGNHEYDTGTASGYLTYFGSQAAPNGTTWYSFDVGNFHFVALDSDCSFVGGCGTTSPQYQWLKADLAASTTSCLIAYFHHAPWSSSVGYGKPTVMVPIMQLLQGEGADAILAGHMHSYERFARMNANGNIDPTGFRTFVVGTGGDAQFALGSPVTGSEAMQTGTYGLLRLDLHAGSYDWHFVPVAGSTYTDAGTDTC
jgi:hypothetical protein